MKKVLLGFLVITIALTSCNNYDDEFDTLNASIAALQSQVSSIATLQSSLTTIQNTVTSLQTGLEGTDSDLSVILANMATLQADVDALIVDFSDADLAAVQETLAVLQADVDELLESHNVPILLKTYEISMSSLYSVPANTGRDETGMARLALFDNGVLGVDIKINNLSSTDVLTAAHIHSGDLVSNGGVLITLVDFQNISFVNGRATGIVLLNAQQVAEIQGSDLYVNVHSQEIPSGLVRGSVDKVIDFAMDVTLMPDYEIPAVTGRNETGIAHLRLTSDSELYFSLTVNDLSPTDMLTASHIHLGDLVSNGGVSTALATSFGGNSASGMVMLNTQQVSDLKGDNVYVNVHSQDNPGGLVRGSVDKVIDFAMDVLLSPSNSVPAIVGRNETGIAYLRLTADSDLYYKLIVNDLDSGDALTAAHIHAASSGVNGGVFQALAGGPTDFDITKMVSFDAAKRATFLSDNLYVNAHSTQQPGGLLRGQIR